MDSSARLDFIKGEFALSASQLTPEETVAALRAAIGYCGEALKHVPMESIEQIAKDWEGIAGAVADKKSRGSTPVTDHVNGLYTNTHLLRLHIESGLSTHGQMPGSMRYVKRAIYVDRKGRLVVRHLVYEKHAPPVPPYQALLMSPQRFHLCRQELLLEMAADSWETWPRAIDCLYYAVQDAHQRRLTIASELGLAEFRLQALHQRIGG